MEINITDENNNGSVEGELVDTQYQLEGEFIIMKFNLNQRGPQDQRIGA